MNWELTTHMHDMGDEVDLDDLSIFLIERIDSLMYEYFLTRRYVRRFDIDYSAKLVK